jgi:hypothetical protein
LYADRMKTPLAAHGDIRSNSNAPNKATVASTQ